MAVNLNIHNNREVHAEKDTDPEVRELNKETENSKRVPVTAKSRSQFGHLEFECSECSLFYIHVLCGIKYELIVFLLDS